MNLLGTLYGVELEELGEFLHELDGLTRSSTPNVRVLGSTQGFRAAWHALLDLVKRRSSAMEWRQALDLMAMRLQGRAVYMPTPAMPIYVNDKFMRGAGSAITAPLEPAPPVYDYPRLPAYQPKDALDELLYRYSDNLAFDSEHEINLRATLEKNAPPKAELDRARYLALLADATSGS